MSNKPDSSKLNTFYVLHVLENYSDENYPLSIMDITKKINDDFGYLAVSGTIISSDTVKRILEELTDKIFIPAIDDEQISHRFGFLYTV